MGRLRKGWVEWECGENAGSSGKVREMQGIVGRWGKCTSSGKVGKNVGSSGKVGGLVG